MVSRVEHVPLFFPMSGFYWKAIYINSSKEEFQNNSNVLYVKNFHHILLSILFYQQPLFGRPAMFQMFSNKQYRTVQQSTQKCIMMQKQFINLRRIQWYRDAIEALPLFKKVHFSEDFWCIFCMQWHYLPHFLRAPTIQHTDLKKSIVFEYCVCRYDLCQSSGFFGPVAGRCLLSCGQIMQSDK